MARKRKPKEPNWEKIQVEYVTTAISQRNLAKKHGVPYNTLKRKSAEGGWVKLRTEHKRKVTANAADAIAGAQARDLADLIECVDMHLAVLKKIYADEEQFNLHLVETENDAGKCVEERKFRKMDTRAMKDCVQQLDKLLGMYRDLHDLPNKIQRETQRIADEKLELEKKKAAAEEQQDSMIEVVFEGADVEEWSG